MPNVRNGLRKADIYQGKILGENPKSRVAKIGRDFSFVTLSWRAISSGSGTLLENVHDRA